MEKIYTEKEIFEKILSGKATLENPYYKPCLEIMDVIAFLKQNKKKVPKLIEGLFEELHQKNLSYDPLRINKSERRNLRKG